MNVFSWSFSHCQVSLKVLCDTLQTGGRRELVCIVNTGCSKWIDFIKSKLDNSISFYGYKLVFP